jgi:hypothetical protein
MFRPELFRESPGKSEISGGGLQGLQGTESCDSGGDSPARGGEGGGRGGMGLLLKGSTRLGNDRVLPGDSVVLLTHSVCVLSLWHITHTHTCVLTHSHTHTPVCSLSHTPVCSFSSCVCLYVCVCVCARARFWMCDV